MMYKATGVWDEALTAAVDDSGPLRQPHKQPPTSQIFRANFGAKLEGGVAGGYRLKYQNLVHYHKY